MCIRISPRYRNLFLMTLDALEMRVKQASAFLCVCTMKNLFQPRPARSETIPICGKVSALAFGHSFLVSS